MKDSRSADVNFLSCGPGQKRDTREQRESEPIRTFRHLHNRAHCGIAHAMRLLDFPLCPESPLACHLWRQRRSTIIVPQKSGESFQKDRRIRGLAHRGMDRRGRNSTLKHLQHASAALLVPSGSSLIDARRPSSESGAGKAGPVWTI